MTTPSSSPLPSAARAALLWLLFSTACAAEDHGTAREAAEELKGTEGGWRAEAAHAFALLQAGKPVLAMRELDSWRHLRHHASSVGLKRALTDSYRADSLVSTSPTLASPSPSKATVQTVQTVLDLSRSALSHYRESGQGEVRCPAKRRRTEAALVNNEAVALAVAGKVPEAVTLLTDLHDSPSLKTFTATFNLTALLLSTGAVQPAIKVWLNARGCGGVWERNNERKLELLKEAREEAVSRMAEAVMQ